jgi:hypothetical protein
VQDLLDDVLPGAGSGKPSPTIPSGLPLLDFLLGA